METADSRHEQDMGDGRWDMSEGGEVEEELTDL